MNTYRNKEGYRDRVAGQAIREVEKEERRKEKRKVGKKVFSKKKKKN